MIRDYNETDHDNIIILGEELHNNYKFNHDVFTNCKVIELNNVIIGFITYSIIYDRAELVDLIIKEQHRNKGYGNKLMMLMINDSITGGCKNITLEVNVNNDCAIKLYKKYGFKVVATRKGYYNGVDAYLMELNLEVVM